MTSCPAPSRHVLPSKPAVAPPTVDCHECTRQLFDGVTLTARVVKVRPDGRAMAKCKWCKQWTLIPLRLDI